MPPVVEHLPRGARVLVIRLRSLGDCVLTTPALSLLHEYRPDLTIGVVVEQRFADLFRNNPAVSEILEPRLLPVMRFGSDLTIDFHGGTRAARLTRISMAKQRAGFGHYRSQWAYNIQIPRAQEILGEERTVHTAEHLCSAMFYLGVPRQEIPRAQLFAHRIPGVGQPYAVMHPFASQDGKAWAPTNFLKVARVLRIEHGLEVAIVGGPGDNTQLFKDFRVFHCAPLEEVAALMQGASLFVGNDSGPAHMAAAFGVPVVVLFGNSDRNVWAPWKTRSIVLEASAGGIRGVSMGQVTAAARQMLEGA